LICRPGGDLLNGVQQLTVLGLTMALFSGLVGITLLVRLLHFYPLRFLRVMLYCLLLFNLLIVFGIAFRYAELHLIEVLSAGWMQALGLTVLDLMAVLKLCFVYAFLEMNAQLTGHRYRDRFKRVYWMISIIAVGLLITLSFTALLIELSSTVFSLHAGLEWLILSAIFIGIFQQLFRSFNLTHRRIKIASLVFSGVHVMVFSAVTVSVALGSLLGTSQPSSLPLFNSLTMFFYNALLVAWAYRYIPVLEPVLERESTARRDIGHQLERFGITHREREVIELICQGKSNQEIADALFISLQTVKDHNYNIYQKTGVKNRVGLVKLFTDLA